MIWEASGKLKGEPVIVTHETDDDYTREEARDEMLHSIPMVDGEFKGMPKVDCGVPPVFRDSLCPHGGGARFC